MNPPAVRLLLPLLLCLFCAWAVRAETAAANSTTGGVLTGIDVLERDDFRQLQGRHVGLITNQTGIDRHGESTIQLLHQAPGVDLVALFSPEHGLEGKLDIPRVDDGEDRATGLRTFSLYGETREPDARMLEGIDTLVFDIQDIGTRFYTYISTLGLALRSAAENGLRFVVLDRPNPINGDDVAGPVAAPDELSFTAFHPLPVRHGMTVGELALMFREELGLDLDLEIVRLAHWQRADYFDATGLLWVNPSPNMRSLTQALLYPGVGLLETTNLSVGRGTDTPFEVIGAPWLAGEKLARRLNSLGLPGVAFVPIRFTPDAGKFSGEDCGGVNLLITDRAVFEPLRTGFEIARQLRLLYPERWEVESYGRLLASPATLEAIARGLPVEEVEAGYRTELQHFAQRRARYLLYD